MKTRTLLSSAALFGAVVALATLAPTLCLASIEVFYGGDADGRGRRQSYSEVAESGELKPVSMVYDNFKLEKATTITGLWGNFSAGISSLWGSSFTEGLPLGAYFEIRSGVSTGIPGTILQSGELKLTPKETGRSFGSEPGSPEFRLFGELDPSYYVLLSAGVDYWIGIAPSENQVSVSITSGGNVGPAGDPNPNVDPSDFWSPIGDGNSFISSSGQFFEPIGPMLDENGNQQNVDFSYGVEGVPVPEPSTFIAGALLALPFGLQGLRYLRNRKRAV